MIKGIIRSLLVFFIFIMAFVTFILTPSGLRISIDIASHFLPGKLSIQKVSGVIVGPLTLQDVKYQDKEQIITLHTLHLNWSPTALLKGQLHITTLKIDELHIITTQKTLSEKRDAEKIKKVIHIIIEYIRKNCLPLHFTANNITITQLTILDPIQKTTMQIKKLFLHTIFTNKKWDTLFSADVTQPNHYLFRFSITGKPTDYALHTLIEGRNIAWELSAMGNQQTLTFTTLNNKILNGTLTAKGKIQFHTTPQWDISLLGQEINAFSFQIKSNNLHSQAHIQWNLKSGKTQDAQINLSGDLKHHIVTAQYRSQKEKINILLDGSLNHHNEWNGALKQFTIALTHSAQWQLKKEATLSVSPKSAQLSSVCLASTGKGQVCMQGSWINQQLTAHAEFNIVTLTWLKTWWPRIHISNGKLVGSLNAHGTLDQPNLTGTLRFKQGNIIFPRLAVALHDITATIISKNHLIDYQLQTFSQQKPINVQGVIDLSKPDFQTEMTITSNNALIVNTDEYTAYATSNLNIMIKNNNIFLTGKVLIPKGNIHPNDFHNTTTLPARDIVYVGVDQLIKKSNWGLYIDGTLTLGNDIHLDAAGVDAQIYGTVHMMQAPNQDMFGTGQIYVRKGTYAVYGQKLTLEPKSYISFNNDLLSNPTLSLKATKVIHSIENVGTSGFSRSNLIVGIELQGTVKKPKISFFSNRARLSEADILSYLLLGYSGSATNNPGNTDLLLRAVSAFNITTQGLLGKQNIATQIESGLGLNELGVESETTLDSLGNPLNRQSAFVVGKNLTRHLGVRYSIGFLNAVNVFELRYLFNRKWSVQTDSSSNGNGADVLYTTEKN